MRLIRQLENEAAIIIQKFIRRRKMRRIRTFVDGYDKGI